MVFSRNLTPGTAARVVARKVVLDISVFALPYYTAFYVCLNSLAGVSWSESKLELEQKMIPTLATTTVFWVPAQTLNFRYSLTEGVLISHILKIYIFRLVLPKYRVIYLASCTFIEFNILAVFKKWNIRER